MGRLKIVAAASSGRPLARRRQGPGARGRTLTVMSETPGSGADAGEPGGAPRARPHIEASRRVAQIMRAAEDAATELRQEAERRADARIAEASRAAELRVAAAEEEAADIIGAARQQAAALEESARA